MNTVTLKRIIIDALNCIESSRTVHLDKLITHGVSISKDKFYNDLKSLIDNTAVVCNLADYLNSKADYQLKKFIELYYCSEGITLGYCAKKLGVHNSTIYDYRKRVFHLLFKFLYGDLVIKKPEDKLSKGDIKKVLRFIYLKAKENAKKFNIETHEYGEYKLFVSAYEAHFDRLFVFFSDFMADKQHLVSFIKRYFIQGKKSQASEKKADTLISDFVTYKNVYKAVCGDKYEDNLKFRCNQLKNCHFDTLIGYDELGISKADITDSNGIFDVSAYVKNAYTFLAHRYTVNDKAVPKLDAYGVFLDTLEVYDCTLDFRYPLNLVRDIFDWGSEIFVYALKFKPEYECMIEHQVKSLPHNLQVALKHKYQEHLTLAKSGEMTDVSAERARQRRQKALRLLRHPSRSASIRCPEKYYSKCMEKTEE